MNKRDTKKVLRDIKVRLENIIEMEKGIDYSGDDDFRNNIEYVFGSVYDALGDIKEALRQ